MLVEVKYCQKIEEEYFNQPMNLTDDEEGNFKEAINCHICNRKFKETDANVKDHCHITKK